MNVIHRYREAQITVGIQYHASVVLGFDATFTTLTDHSKITAYIIYLNKKIFLLIILNNVLELWTERVIIFLECNCRRYKKWGFFPSHNKTFLKPIHVFFRLYNVYFEFKYQMWSHLQSETVEYKQGAERSKQAWHLYRSVFSLTYFSKHTVLLVKQVSQVPFLSSSKVLNSSVLFDNLSSPNKC